MKKEITVRTVQDFEKLMDKGDLRVSNFIVNTILSNLTTKKKNVHALSIIIEEGETENNEIFDITVNRDYFITTLQEQLKIQELFEQYETCQNITEGIKFLEKNLENKK